ncbi:MAG: HlyC/CorC family transporter [Candidatus Marinimicrobia bacterium]|nr:HlyC/CorC family transporter [Candidatus Neomarinimicrobiota bacterium]
MDLEFLNELFLYKLISLLILMLISAFFSSSETAYFSLKASRIKELAEENGKGTKRLLNLLREPRKLLITILTGNTIVNVAIASLAALMALDVAQYYGIEKNIVIIAEIIIITIAVLIISEVTPKLAAVRRAEKIAKFFALPLSFVHLILQPIAKIIYGFTDFVLKAMGVEKKMVNLDENEIRTLVDVGEEKGTLEKEEHKMLHGIFELSDTKVREIMVPRTDVIMLSIESSLNEAIKVVRKSKFSRIPVYRESVDDIVGILYSRDLLPFIEKKDSEGSLSAVIKPVFYVPETKMIDELLREFQDKRRKLALVVDEYGGLSGLVTLEDILEEIVGEIQDEHDDEEPIFKRISENLLDADAKWDLDDAEDELGISFPKEEGYDSLGGFLFHQFGEIPEKGQKISHSGVVFKVLEVHSNRIIRVKIDTKDKITDVEDS